MKVVCDYCQRPASLVDGSVLYPHRPALRRKWFWRCEPCQAWVGCHEGAKHTPLGRLANAELREVRHGAHALFDPLWMSGTMSRSDAYAWLASELQMETALCHIGWMDVADCHRVMDAVLARPRSRELIERKRSPRQPAPQAFTSPVVTQRLFIGLMADEALQRELTSHQRQWTWPASARLVSPANFHLTLRFLGDTEDALQDRLLECLGLVRFDPFVLRLTDPGAVEGGTSWLGPVRSAPLEALRKNVNATLRKAVVLGTEEAFHPHVTLARKSAGAVPPASPVRIDWPVDRFSLVRSERGRYLDVATWHAVGRA